MSFNIATTGLKAITEQLDAISNNIANSGTVGFKSGRAEFAALYAEGQPLGVGVTGITQSITKGGTISAGQSALDLAISGNGFFMVKSRDGSNLYTRAGYFGTDSDGNLINNAGMNLQGYPVNANGVLQVGTLGNLTISSGSIPARATDGLNFSANLDARASKPAKDVFDPKDSESYNNAYTTQVYDSLGREHTIRQYFVKTEDNKWAVHYYMNDEPLKSPATQDIEFTEQGILKTPADGVELSVDIPGAERLSFALNYRGSTQYGSDFSVNTNKATGYASGTKTGQQIDQDGSVYATFSNGERMLQGQLVLVNFANPNGLQAQDGTTWMETSTSGQPLFGAPGSGQLGAIKAGMLEASNVDLTSQLIGLMSAQSNYQAVSKVVSTINNTTSALLQAVG